MRLVDPDARRFAFSVPIATDRRIPCLAELTGERVEVALLRHQPFRPPLATAGTVASVRLTRAGAVGSAGAGFATAAIISDLRTAGFDVGAKEQFGAQPQPPIDVRVREVRKADVVVLLIGPRYGSLLPQGISYTHAEFP